MAPITFGLVGSGWRAEFFLRVAAALPDRFRCGGALVREEGKGRRFEETWSIPTFRTIDAVLRGEPLAFVVLSVPRAVAPSVLRDLAARRMPVLTETPPAPDLDGLRAVWDLVAQGARIQVAEQYLMQPLHAARLAVVHSGKLGRVSQAQASVAHDYHGVSLLRALLGVGFANATVTARTFTSALVAGPDRHGPPREERITNSTQVLAQLDFGDRLGLYDFTSDQYFSWTRALRLLVRGERGEINDKEVRYLQTFDTPVTLALRRENAGEDGNLEGYYLKGILVGTEWVYRNPFSPARLTDDEIAVATCLERMAAYVEGGPACYSFAEAAQDHYLSLAIKEASLTGAAVTTTTQPWAS